MNDIEKVIKMMKTEKTIAVYQQIVRLIHAQEAAREQKHEMLLAEFGDYTITQLHILSTIETYPATNNRLLSDELGVTKAAVSKAITKLLDRQLVESYQQEDNQKAVFYRLTDAGKTIHQKHMTLHHIAESQYLEFLVKYDDEVLDNAEFFLIELIKHLEK